MEYQERVPRDLSNLGYRTFFRSTHYWTCSCLVVVVEFAGLITTILRGRERSGMEDVTDDVWMSRCHILFDLPLATLDAKGHGESFLDFF